MTRLAHYLFDLGLFSRQVELGGPTAPTTRRRRRWVAACYVVFCLGIAARELTAFPTMKVVDRWPGWRVPAAAFIVGLALFPPVLRWVSRRSKGQPKVEHFLWCFSFGFFWSLVAAQVVPQLQKLLTT